MPATSPRTPATTKPKREPKVTAAVQIACSAMVEQGFKLDEAAREAGITTRALRLALEKPHVLAYLRKRKQVFREHISAANISVLAEIRDDAGNAMARLGAVKLLEQVDEDAERKAARRTPGIAIVFVNSHRSSDDKPMTTIDISANDESAE